MPADAKAYHVQINGKGYILVDGSRLKRSQMPVWPRFSTGDYGYTDLSFWQFTRQTDFTGGAGQKDFLVTNQYQVSSGMSFRNLKPQLSRGSVGPNWQSVFTALAGTTSPAKIIKAIDAGSNSDLLVLVDGTQTFDGSVSAEKVNNGSALANFRQLFSRDAIAWQRPGTTAGTLLACLRSSGGTEILRLYTSGFGIANDFTTGGSDGDAKVLVPIDNNSILLAGSAKLRVIKFNGNAFTAASNLVSNIYPYGASIVPQYYATDSAGTVYLAFQPYAGSAGMVALITTTDMVLADGPRISETVLTQNFVINAVSDVGGTVYLFGAEVRYTSGGTYYIPQVRKFPGGPNNVVWQAQAFGASAADANAQIWNVSRINRNRTLFIANQQYGDNASIFSINDAGAVHEECAVGLPSSTTNRFRAVYHLGDQYFWYDVNATSKIVVSDLPGSPAYSALKNTGGKPRLLTSAFSANTPLVNKSLYSILVDVSEALPPGSFFTVYANGTQIGTFSDADGTHKELVVPSEVTSTSFQIEFVFEIMSWLGYVKSVALRYVPVQIKKRAWGLAVRCENNQKLLNDERDRRRGFEKFNDLEAAWRSNVPIQFTDVDGATYNVIVTEYSERMPLIKTNRLERESVVSLELLEI